MRKLHKVKYGIWCLFQWNFIDSNTDGSHYTHFMVPTIINSVVLKLIVVGYGHNVLDGTGGGTYNSFLHTFFTCSSKRSTFSASFNISI